ncbi:methyl-accepting chemotaxis protein [Pullulanibacillus pueri]|uniref:MotA/TolQ/ExbB proton channel domain-containing protein n=1 Tax=Pullulanibacillus pueri TaxID=1437324 RepID=A0A8J3EMY0_9BACL|nr:hypothetical protein [Pullulanibacillus pueri]MBM7683090.1 methyl-accepting chemotaxis protein [Pullulanibacillus pueri]GGH84838.1 hypothetical protein GCM10007096_28830 [Pullulanibacillus pueri]
MNLTAIIVGAIGLLLLIGIITQIQTSQLLRRWIEDIKSQNSTSLNLRTPWLRETFEEYKTYRLTGIEINSQALVEKNLFNEKVWLAGVIKAPIGNITKMVSHLPSFTIILGVLGTFLGLTFSMFSMQDTLLTLGDQTGNGNLSVDSIVSAIASPFKGMSLAFITSIAGIGSAFILNLIQAGFLSGGRSISYLTQNLLTESEALLDHKYEAQLQSDKPKDSFEKILDRLANKIGESFHSTIGDFNRDMVHFTERLDASMQELQNLINNEKQRSTLFLEATQSMEASGTTFERATKLFEETNQGVSGQIHSLKEAIEQTLKRMETHEKRMEQASKQTQGHLDQSNKRIEEISQQFLRALDQQMDSYQDKYDHASSTLQRQQEDWLYQHQEMNNRYAESTDTLSSGLDQLERSLYQMFEKIKREVLEQIKYQNDRQAQMFTQNDHRQDTRDIIRHLEALSCSFENLSHGIDRNSSDSVRYMQEFYQLLTRISQHLEQQALQQRPSHGLPSRVIDT